MLQILYVSTVSGNPNLDPILAVSRRNNRAAGVTGLLYADDRRFLQVIEGPTEAVESTFHRIQADDRHRAHVVLSRREVAQREFGEWDMAARRPDEEVDALLARVIALAAGATPDIRATFEGLAGLRRAA